MTGATVPRSSPTNEGRAAMLEAPRSVLAAALIAEGLLSVSCALLPWWVLPGGVGWLLAVGVVCGLVALGCVALRPRRPVPEQMLDVCAGLVWVVPLVAIGLLRTLPGTLMWTAVLAAGLAALIAIRPVRAGRWHAGSAILGFALVVTVVPPGLPLPVGIPVLVSLIALATVLFAMAEQQQRLVEALRAEASTDALTVVLNRRGLAEQAYRLQATGQRAGWCSVVVAVDVDGLKAVNDAHGHHMGNQALRRACG